MRKVINLSLSVLLVVGAIAYCISWYAQAAQAKRAVEQAIARINEKQTYLTYESIETSGFPSTLYVAIVKPRFNGRVDQLLKGQDISVPPPAPAMPAATPPFAGLPEWTEDVALDGQIILGINALSSRYTLNVVGNWSSAGTIGGQPVAMTLQSQGVPVCSLELAGAGLFASMWNFESIDRGDRFLHDFRMFDCSNSGYVISDAHTQEKLMQSSPSRFYISSTPLGDTRQIRLYVKSADVEVTPAGDKIMQAYYKALAPDQPYPPSLSIYGKQNIEIDFSYSGPIDWQGTDLKNTPLAVDLSKFEITNQVYNASATFSLFNGMAGPSHSSKLALRADSAFGEPYDVMIRTMARNFVQELYNSKDPKFVQAQPYTAKYTPDELYAIVYPAIPNFHSLGKLAQGLDVSFLGTPDMTSGDITLTALELSADAYGITGSGSAKLVPGQLFPTANVVLICRNCFGLVDDASAYIVRVQKAMSYFEPEQANSFTVTPQLVEGIKDFLKVIAEPTKDPSSLTYTLVSDPAAGITVSGHRLDEVMALHKEYIGTALRQQQPAQ